MRRILWLDPCELCGHPFRVDYEWWYRRLISGGYRLTQCPRCHPAAYETHPEPKLLLGAVE